MSPLTYLVHQQRRHVADMKEMQRQNDVIKLDPDTGSLLDAASGSSITFLLMKHLYDYRIKYDKKHGGGVKTILPPIREHDDSYIRIMKIAQAGCTLCTEVICDTCRYVCASLELHNIMECGGADLTAVAKTMRSIFNKTYGPPQLQKQETILHTIKPIIETPKIGPGKMVKGIPVYLKQNMAYTQRELDQTVTYINQTPLADLSYGSTSTFGMWKYTINTMDKMYWHMSVAQYGTLPFKDVPTLETTCYKCALRDHCMRLAAAYMNPTELTFKAGSIQNELELLVPKSHVCLGAELLSQGERLIEPKKLFHPPPPAIDFGPLAPLPPPVDEDMTLKKQKVAEPTLTRKRKAPPVRPAHTAEIYQRMKLKLIPQLDNLTTTDDIKQWKPTLNISVHMLDAIKREYMEIKEDRQSQSEILSLMRDDYVKNCKQPTKASARKQYGKYNDAHIAAAVKELGVELIDQLVISPTFCTIPNDPKCDMEQFRVYSDIDSLQKNTTAAFTAMKQTQQETFLLRCILSTNLAHHKRLWSMQNKPDDWDAYAQLTWGPDSMVHRQQVLADILAIAPRFCYLDTKKWVWSSWMRDKLSAILIRLQRFAQEKPEDFRITWLISK